MTAESNESTAIQAKVKRIVHLKVFPTPKIGSTGTGDLGNPNDSEDDWKADNESYMEWANGREDSETPGHRNVSSATNVPGLIRPT